ncbi:TPA: hypothetical protein ACXN34_005965 [Burkholderia cepacia]|uniref:hypothetical protein n=1 Tax=Burkholderia cepacia TaxID=292 RepID=UPI001589356B|nr:hypothetical protein [Burkholderia cepacia]MCA8165242.1 hypothetical protein [Burkholderia cepacia]
MISAANRCHRAASPWPDRPAMRRRHPAAPTGTTAAGTREPDLPSCPACRGSRNRAVARGRHPRHYPAARTIAGEPVRVERA